MIEQAPGITRLLDRLIRKQLVSRSRSQDDARQVICRITPRGLRLLATMDRPVLDADIAALAPLGAAGQRRLISLLARLAREP
jgi:DNA-binding MarR family transcriptional regulator